MKTILRRPKPEDLRDGKVVRAFDPWGSPLCTCPPKYSLQPYTGCSHFCLYCYATAYIGLKKSTPKKNYKQRLIADLPRLARSKYHVDLSTSSDPYPPEEEKYRLTRWTLEKLVAANIPVLIITKGAHVVRDVDILAKGRIAVTITITTLDHSLAAKIEPGAPPPKERIHALSLLSNNGIPVGLRLDPIIPFLNDDEQGINEVLEAAANVGVKFVVSSTYKARPDNFSRMAKAFPELAKRWTRLYRVEGKWMYGYWYLPSSLRKRLMERVAILARRHGLKFATCREGFPHLHTAPSCDGSHLIPRFKPNTTMNKR